MTAGGSPIRRRGDGAAERPGTGRGAGQAPAVEPGSFRDPESRVFYGPDGVFRALSRRGLEDWRAFAATGLLPALVGEGKVVETELVEDGAGIPGSLRDGYAAVLRHARIPFVSYPYEWPFGMLRDAALLQLELLRVCLAEDIVLKDSSPYNFQWRGSRPVFVDVGSFERLPEGEPWIGYRQFCMLFLYPLMLRAHKRVPYQPWLRGAIDGITPQQFRNLMSFRDRFRRGVFRHVHLHSKLERRYGDRGRDVRREVRSAGFGKQLIEANVKGLEKIVNRLRWTPETSVWTEYGATTTYTDADAERKAAFVREVAHSRPWSLAWDLGCNDGHYSRIAAEGARYVVAVDADEGAVEQLYASLKREGREDVLPLTMNLADPSPGLGWRGLERKSLPARGRPDLVICLALIHHVAISSNVPVREFVDWLAGLGASLVIEFVKREDPMAQRLLAAKREGLHEDYDAGFFERCLSEAFTVERREVLESGSRILYFAHPGASSSATS